MTKHLRNQKGATMVIVLMLLVLLVILGFSAISMADNQTKRVSWHQQREQALQYAEAGIHRYMAELSKDPNFYKTQASTNMQNIDTVYQDGYFKIVCTQPSIADPYINVTSTGWHKNSANIKRTITAKLQKKDLLQNAATTNTGSDVFWYTNRYMRGDVIYGPLHINGNLVVSGKVGDDYADGGPLFYDKVTYSGNYIIEPGSWFASDTKWFNPVYNTVDGEVKPEKVPRTGMPSMNEDLRAQADEDYVFQGRTCIYIDGSTLYIRNKGGSRTSTSLPSNGIIYVRGNTGNNKWGLNTANVFVSGKLNGRLTIAAENDIYITATDPTAWDTPNAASTPASSGGVTYYDLNNQTITADNRNTLITGCDDMLGLIANRNVRILHYYWPKADGYTNGWGSPSERDVAPNNLNIHAAICAVTGSFEYEEHRDGPKKGTLTVLGSVIQNRTGPLSGYSVNLVDLDSFTNITDPLHDRLSGYGRIFMHDPRMMYESPPSFMGPNNSGWEIIEWHE